MSIQRLQQQFTNGELSKADFIQACYQVHDGLFDYSALMQQGEVSEVAISADGVVFTLRPFGLKLAAPRYESRTTPIEAMNFLRYEPEALPVFDLLVDHAATALDVGGNIGYFSVRSAIRKPALTLHAFEPMPTSFEFLTKNVALNGLQDRITCHNFGLADQNGEVTFYIAPFNGVNASLQNVANAEDSIKHIGQIQRMDDWCAQSGVAPDLLKCDVEGAELLVFKGAERTLAEQTPMIFTEMLRKWAKAFDYHPNDMIAYLAGFGYRCFGLSLADDGKAPENVLRLIGEVTEETEETNYVFLHPEKHTAVLDDLRQKMRVLGE